MSRYLIIAIIGIAAALASGCGSDDDEQASGAAAGGGGAETVALKDVEGIGRVLVDAAGAALYTADQEEDGDVRCVDECLAFWQPLTASGTPTAADDVTGTLDVIERDDGSRQVTYDGRPVYRFSEDAEGEVTGDGFEDEFGGTTFSWQAVTVGERESGGGGGGGGGVYGY